jgi:hypothetical protein
MNPALRPDASLPEVLAARARDASDGRLVLNAACGLLLVGAMALFRPPVWPILASAGLCFIAFGFWGIADRELRERSDEPRSRLVSVLEIGRLACVVLGSLGGLVLVFSTLRLVLGTWIS